MIYKQTEVIDPGGTLTILLISKWDKRHFNEAKDLIEDKSTRRDIDFPVFMNNYSFYIHRESENANFYLIADHNNFPFEDRLMASSIINDIYVRVIGFPKGIGKLKLIGKAINEVYMAVTEMVITDSKED